MYTITQLLNIKYDAWELINILVSPLSPLYIIMHNKQNMLVSADADGDADADGILGGGAAGGAIWSASPAHRPSHRRLNYHHGTHTSDLLV